MIGSGVPPSEGPFADAAADAQASLPSLDQASDQPSDQTSDQTHPLYSPLPVFKLQGPSTAEEAHAPAMARGALCRSCALWSCGEGPVLGEIVPDAKLLVVGEAPGRGEVIEGRPFCLGVETQVLYADLTWRALGTAQVGDELLTVEERGQRGHTGASGSSTRRWRVTQITAVHHFIRPAVHVVTSRGTLIATDDHRVLTKKAAKTMGWHEVGSLIASETKRASAIAWAFAPWDAATSDTYAYGWLAGFLDGEGHVSGSRSGTRQCGIVGFSQNEGPVLARAITLLRAIGFDIVNQSRQKFKGSVCRRCDVRGGIFASLRLLGTLRSVRLLADMARVLRARNVYARGLERAIVYRKELTGAQHVVDITTTEGTFIANGFVVHNCGQSGTELEIGLTQGGLTRADCSITNTILCRPPENRALKDFLTRLGKTYRRDVAHAKREAEKTGQPAIEVAPPGMSPIEACRPRLIRDIEETNAKTLLAVGGAALEALAKHAGIRYGKKKLKKEDESETETDDETAAAQHAQALHAQANLQTDAQPGAGPAFVATISQQFGAPVQLPDGRILCSTLHPAFAMHENHQYKYMIRDHVARGGDISRRGVLWPEVRSLVFPRVEDVERILSLFVRERATVMADTETSSIDPDTCMIRCIGFGAWPLDIRKLRQLERTHGAAALRQLDLHDLLRTHPVYPETIIVVPLRWKDGRPYWPTRALTDRVVRAIQDVFTYCPIATQNGPFDTRTWTRTGLQLDKNKPFIDCRILHKNTDSNDLPHDLGLMARQAFEAGIWKGDIDWKAEDEAQSDRDLYVYCGKDVGGQLRLLPQLTDQVTACGTEYACSIEHALLPHMRRMGELGLVIDERERGTLSAIFNRITSELRDEIDRLVGRPINPRSPKQICDWLYDEKGYSPQVNTEGFEYEEGDDPSASIPALMALADKAAEMGVDDRTQAALEKLLEFKAAEVIRSRYLDKTTGTRNPETYNPVGYTAPPVKDLLVEGRAPAVTARDWKKKGAPERVIIPERPARSLMNLDWMLTIPTGRWTVDPTIHQIPARGWAVPQFDPKTGQTVVRPINARRMIVAAPGHVLVGGEFKTVEGRIYAARAGDRLMFKSFTDIGPDGRPYDLHAMNMASLKVSHLRDLPRAYAELMALEKTDKSTFKAERTVAKRFVFAELYGGSPKIIYKTMKSERDKATNRRVFPRVTPAMVDTWDENFHALHPECKPWQRSVTDFYIQHGYVASLRHGRRRYFVGGSNKDDAPTNMEIQSTSQDFTNEAVLRIVEEIPFGCWSPWTGLVAEWHDHLCVQVPESRVDQAVAIMNKCMTFEFLGLPIIADVASGRDWGRTT